MFSFNLKSEVRRPRTASTFFTARSHTSSRPVSAFQSRPFEVTDTVISRPHTQTKTQSDERDQWLNDLAIARAHHDTEVSWNLLTRPRSRPETPGRGLSASATALIARHNDLLGCTLRLDKETAPCLEAAKVHESVRMRAELEIARIREKKCFLLDETVVECALGVPEFVLKGKGLGVAVPRLPVDPRYVDARLEGKKGKKGRKHEWTLLS